MDRARRLPRWHRRTRRVPTAERGHRRDAGRPRKVPRITASQLTAAYLPALCELKSFSSSDEKECPMRKVVARIFDYSLDGVISEEGTECFDYCRDVPDDLAQEAHELSLFERADVLIMGRVQYQGTAQFLPTAGDDHPYAAAVLAAPKIVFSRT